MATTAMEPVFAFYAVVPVLSSVWNDYGAERLQDGLKTKGWTSQVVPLQGQKKLEVTIWKHGEPAKESTFQLPGRASAGVTRTGVMFGPEQAALDILSVANSASTKLAATASWTLLVAKTAIYVASGKAAVDAVVTSGKAVGEQAAAYQKALAECKAKGGWFCGLSALGVPTWVPPVAIGLGVIFVLGQVMSIKRGLLGGVGRNDGRY